jgi:hypothetical protein
MSTPPQPPNPQSPQTPQTPAPTANPKDANAQTPTPKLPFNRNSYREAPTTPAPSPAKPRPKPPPKDANESCPGWAKRGECTANPAYMQQFCRLSCGKCAPRKQA